MTIVASYDWESDTFSTHRDAVCQAQTDATRRPWQEAVATITEKAQAALPDSNGRVEKAAQIVLNGDVELLPDGHARVTSQTNGVQQYHLTNGTCECFDFATAPQGFCKHRLAVGIAKRAQALLDVSHSDQANITTDAEPVALLDAPPHGIAAEHIVEIQGKRFVKFVGLLALAHARGLTDLQATWTYNDAGLSLAHAVAVFPFGRFEECGDASPENVTKKVSPHFRRVALTRAKARVLRDALNVDMVSLEELSE